MDDQFYKELLERWKWSEESSPEWLSETRIRAGRAAARGVAEAKRLEHLDLQPA